MLRSLGKTGNSGANYFALVIWDFGLSEVEKVWSDATRSRFGKGSTQGLTALNELESGNKRKKEQEKIRRELEMDF